MGLLKTIFILLLVYYGLKFLTKLFAPFLVKKAVDTMQKKASKFQNQQQAQTNVKEGETVIDKAPRNAQGHTKPVGDYVDFEEID